MEATGIDLDELARKIYILYPNLPQRDDFNKQLKTKLEEQIKIKSPIVVLKQLDLKYIIQHVKKSLSELQNRIDDSLVYQSKRITRTRKSVCYDEDNYSMSSLNCKKSNLSRYKTSTSPKASTSSNTKTDNCSTTRCCQHRITDSDLVGLVQVESLPVTASTNLVTIFVPSILQEKLHSVKYKISIDLNRLDLTKQILDLNLSQLECGLNKNDAKTINRTNGNGHECKITCEINDHNDMNIVQDETQAAVNNIPQIESNTSFHDSQIQNSTAVSIVKEKEEMLSMSLKAKQHATKRKISKNINDPPKKRGRKPGSKNKTNVKKSELARYVEMFECNGNSPSSAISQIVTSTTQNWEVLPDQAAQITYFMNGEWTTLNAPSNDAAHGLVTTTSLEDATENDNFIPFDDFVNFIENPSLDGNNVIARVLEGNVDTQEIVLSSQQNVNICVTDKSKNEINTQTNQFEITTEKIADNRGQSSSSISRVNIKNDNTSKESNNVIFSTCRSMPSLDIEDQDLFSSTPPAGNISDIMTFNMTPKKALEREHNHSFKSNNDTITNDSAIEVDKILLTSSESLKTGTDSNTSSQPSNVQSKREVIKEMSLLEIEKDFDDSLLEFGNCLDDDLLSLAPSSCFNSPIDDRFAESNLSNTEEHCTKSCLDNPSAPAPRCHLESSLITLYEDDINPSLKTFKIPKVKIHEDKLMTGSSTENHSIKTKEMEDLTNFSNLFPETSSKTLTKNVSLNQSCISGGSSQNILIHDISKMFGSICFKFLADLCFETNCKFNHTLISGDIISISVSVLGNTALNSVYRFVWRNHKLFTFYFPIFCQEYGRRNMRQKLLTMVHDCELQPKCTSFFKHIYISLTGCGFSKVNACRNLLNRVRDRSDLAIDVLVEIIIESDAKMFISAIEQFSIIKGYKYSMKTINELAKVCLRSGSVDLVPAIIKCLINIEQSDFLSLRSPELIQLLEMVKSGSEI